MKNIKVLVFDLDDTLFPEREFVLSGFRSVGNWMLDTYSVSGVFEVAWGFFQEGRRNLVFNQTLEYLGVQYEPSLIQELLQVYRMHPPVVSLFEDAKWALTHFKQCKRLGLLTNGYLATQQNKVKALGIEPFFDSIVYCDLYGSENWKPSPLPYQKMMEFTGVRGLECLYVGDHPHKDFVGAKHWGWTTVRICREGGEFTGLAADRSNEADYEIKTLYELYEIGELCGHLTSSHR
jgi:putative hydrolase of the HAD superfamily